MQNVICHFKIQNNILVEKLFNAPVYLELTQKFTIGTGTYLNTQRGNEHTIASTWFACVNKAGQKAIYY